MSSHPNILCTMPGRHGDLLWSLPTVRAIAESYQQPVDLVISQKYSSLLPLLRLQPYINYVGADKYWEVLETAPMTPRIPPDHPEDFRLETPDHLFHLGYEAWPTPDLPRDIYMRAYGLAKIREGKVLKDLDLHRPWITPPSWANGLAKDVVTVGFTDEYFEYKLGLWMLLQEQIRKRAASELWVNLSNSPRWNSEWSTMEASWETAAAWISRSQVFLGCCSALHVLAAGLGVPVVCVEPSPDRHQQVFWPQGTAAGVREVIGGDGKWTLDARHVWDAVQAVRQEKHAQVEARP